MRSLKARHRVISLLLLFSLLDRSLLLARGEIPMACLRYDAIHERDICMLDEVVGCLGEWREIWSEGGREIGCSSTMIRPS